MAHQHFKTQRATAILKVNTGADKYVVSVDFVPNFIEVVFFDVKNKAAVDVLTWDLAATAVGYDLTITYDVSEPREIRHVIAKLPVDPEMTIAH